MQTITIDRQKNGISDISLKMFFRGKWEIWINRQYVIYVMWVCMYGIYVWYVCISIVEWFRFTTAKFFGIIARI